MCGGVGIFLYPLMVRAMSKCVLYLCFDLLLSDLVSVSVSHLLTAPSRWARSRLRRHEKKRVPGRRRGLFHL